MEFRLRLSWYGSFWNTGGTWFLSTVTRRTPVLLDREGTPRSKARRGTWDTKWQTGQFPVQCRIVVGLNVASSRGLSFVGEREKTQRVFILCGKYRGFQVKFRRVVF